jgi:Uma2 family endonuclease
MATAALISVQEYLATSWRPDRDFVDGEVRERTMGEFSQGRMRGRIVVWLSPRERAWRFRAVPEVRLQISTSRFRIPDVMLVSADAPREEIVRTAPLVCIEILSRSNTVRDMFSKTRIDTGSELQQSVLPHLVAQCIAADSQRPRGLRLVSVGAR